MSRNPKVMSSEDFDAPQLYGDKYGYLNNLFRKCLVEGYNQRLDLTSYQVIGDREVEFTFASEHKYNKDQVIKISDVNSDALHAECLVISTTSTSIVCRYYTDLYMAINTSQNNLSGKTIVAPLGFREKFRNEAGDKSAYVIDQDKEECFFVVDDITPTGWQSLVTSATIPPYICPIVYMTDGMSDINTETGKLIAPYDADNPNKYKTEWVYNSSYPRKGIQHFVSYTGLDTNGYNSKSSVTNNKNPAKWKIIGNGRFFWYIYYNKTNNSNYITKMIHGFGKFESTRNNLNYLLFAKSTGGWNGALYDNPYAFHPYGVDSISNNKSSYQSLYPSLVILEKQDKKGIYNPNISVGNSVGSVSPNSSVFISGYINNSYDLNGKIQFNNFTILEDSTSIGFLPSVKWMNQRTKFIRDKIIELKNNSSKKRYMIIDHNACKNSGGETALFTYAFSLEYEDWKNYD